MMFPIVPLNFSLLSIKLSLVTIKVAIEVEAKQRYMTKLSFAPALSFSLKSNLFVHARMLHVRADTRCIKHNCSKSILIETKEIRAKILSSSFHCYSHYYHLTRLRRVENSCSHSMITLSTSNGACMVLCMVFEGVEGQRPDIFDTFVRVN